MIERDTGKKENQQIKEDFMSNQFLDLPENIWERLVHI